MTNKSYYLPSEQVKGIVKASYFFGKPVAHSQVEVTGRTIIEKPTEIFKVTGLTDETGEFDFRTHLADYFTGMPLAGGNAFLQIEAIVKDTAGHEEKTSEHRVVAQQPINIHVVPESGDSVSSVENLIYIMTAYPDGQPAVCQIEINGSVLTTDDSGIAVFRIVPKADGLTLNIKVNDNKGNTGILVKEIGSLHPLQHFLLRTNKAVYLGGETVYVTVLSARPKGTFFLDVIKDNQTMLTKTLSVEKGKKTLAIDLPPGLFGTLKLNGYTITTEGQSTADSRIVYVHQPSQLKIETSLDKGVYRPAETARVNFKVSDSRGIPTPAALSLSVVDEAVFYVSENRPGLMEQFFLADEELLKPAYQIAFAISPAKLLSGEDEYQTMALALFSSSIQTQDTSRLDYLREYLGPGMIEKLRKNLQDGRYDEFLKDPRFANVADVLQWKEDYTLRATTYHEKIAKTEAFRRQYFEILKATFIVLLLAGLALCLFGTLFYSTFRLIRTAGTGELDPMHAAVQKATNGLVYSYALL
jgi:hypothetical protein